MTPARLISRLVQYQKRFFATKVKYYVESLKKFFPVLSEKGSFIIVSIIPRKRLIDENSVRTKVFYFPQTISIAGFRYSVGM